MRSPQRAPGAGAVVWARRPGCRRWWPAGYLNGFDITWEDDRSVAQEWFAGPRGKWPVLPARPRVTLYWQLLRVPALAAPGAAGRHGMVQVAELVNDIDDGWSMAGRFRIGGLHPSDAWLPLSPRRDWEQTIRLRTYSPVSMTLREAIPAEERPLFAGLRQRGAYPKFPAQIGSPRT